ncbi:unnamed protein product [Peronospora belbahrii]|uniref:Uncharacterized protein n=1 Tax=Peronospora belbahrii TaxID=622444 RepID=A0AAU9KQM0_9STRA|nr:unnamed protein product [Peronospora belbahrii]
MSIQRNACLWTCTPRRLVTIVRCVLEVLIWTNSAVPCCAWRYAGHRNIYGYTTSVLHFPDTRLVQYSFFNAFDCTGSACSIESPSGDGVILTRTFDCGNVLSLCRHQTYPVTNSKGTNVTYSCIAGYITLHCVLYAPILCLIWL